MVVFVSSPEVTVNKEGAASVFCVVVLALTVLDSPLRLYPRT